MQGSEAGYRAAIREAAPNLQVLDDLPLREKPKGGTAVAGKEEDMTACSSVFALSEAGMEKDWRIVQQSIKQGLQLERGRLWLCATPRVLILLLTFHVCRRCGVSSGKTNDSASPQ